ncbi:hypothetical protein C8J57DRAFT_1186089 [Mycena rebaudengoi]|nr:hypothetical protein C8J57DRAFT_1186089 [Mycena rebaudengoi]
MKIPFLSPRICPRPSLPFSASSRSSESYPEVITFVFACGRRASILNCAVIGKDLCPYFHVVTSTDFMPGYTVFRTNEGHNIATVQWLQNGNGAYVELQDTLEKQPVSSWLGVSRDASYRMMYAHGEMYVWVPQNLSICLYHWNPSDHDVPQLLARISRDEERVTLEITVDAINMSLLEMCVIATVLFQSGCQID